MDLTPVRLLTVFDSSNLAGVLQLTLQDELQDDTECVSLYNSNFEPHQIAQLTSGESYLQKMLRELASLKKAVFMLQHWHNH